MTILARVPEAVSQGYRGVEINSLYVKYGASSPVVQIAQQEMGRLVGEIYSQGDPGKRIYEAQQRVKSECAQAFP